MSRTRLVVGNWKMNLSLAGATDLAAAISRGVFSSVEVAVCPAFVHLAAVAERLRGTAVSWGAQNGYHQPEGAFTGEVSMGMLKDLGCRFVILGHSERRQILQESDGDVNRKLLQARRMGLTPIVCVGETLEQREAGRTWEVIEGQLAGSLAGLDAAACREIVLAYEPVWAIGTGKNATPEQAQAVHADLRKWLLQRYNVGLSAELRILYGGSVKPDNTRALMSQPDVDGALVGGASLNAESFQAIVSAAAPPS